MDYDSPLILGMSSSQPDMDFWRSGFNQAGKNRHWTMCLAPILAIIADTSHWSWGYLPAIIVTIRICESESDMMSIQGISPAWKIRAFKRMRDVALQALPGATKGRSTRSNVCQRLWSIIICLVDLLFYLLIGWKESAQKKTYKYVCSMYIYIYI